MLSPKSPRDAMLAPAASARPAITQATLLLWSFYAVAVVMKNIFAIKTWRIGFLSAPAGYLFEPVTFIAQDVEAETRGERSAQRMVWWGFALNLFVALASQVALLLPTTSAAPVEEAFGLILGNTPRILMASVTAYLVGGTLNVRIMAKLKARGQTSLLLRLITSTVIGQLVDNLIFNSLAFSGIMPWSKLLFMALTMTLLETLYEILFFPITRLLIRTIQKHATLA